jgi:hypothetical protein
MTPLRQRDRRQKDAQHLAFVRQQPCCIPFCNRPSEAAHLRMENLAIGKEMTGKGEKPHDKYTVPLCGNHHRDGIDAQHKSNEELWWKLRGLNQWAIADRLWTASGGAERAAMPKPVKQPKPVKARKPRGERTKITKSRRTIPGHKFNGEPIPSRTIAP